jgi:hypothetical protein
VAEKPPDDTALYHSSVDCEPEWRHEVGDDGIVVSRVERDVVAPGIDDRSDDVEGLIRYCACAGAGMTEASARTTASSLQPTASFRLLTAQEEAVPPRAEGADVDRRRPAGGAAGDASTADEAGAMATTAARKRHVVLLAIDRGGSANGRMQRVRDRCHAVE